MIVIDVVVPTVDGREKYLERCLRGYRARSAHTVRIQVVANQPTVGEAWNLGAGIISQQEVPGDYLHLTNDDIEPEPGWDADAVLAVDRGCLPSPRLLGPVRMWGRSLVPIHHLATVESTNLPFMSWGMWREIGPIPPIHYFSDDYVSWKGRLRGWPTVYVEDYAFTHTYAQPGRGAGMTEAARMEHDRKIFERIKAEGFRP